MLYSYAAKILFHLKKQTTHTCKFYTPSVLNGESIYLGTECFEPAIILPIEFINRKCITTAYPLKYSDWVYNNYWASGSEPTCSNSVQ